MKSISKITGAVLILVALLSTAIMSSGCDEDKMWDSASTPYGQVLLLGLLSRGDVYTISVTIDITETWDGLVITIGGEPYTLSSSSSLTFKVRTLLELISNATVSNPTGWSCTSIETTPDSVNKTFTITISGCTKG